MTYNWKLSLPDEPQKVKKKVSSTPAITAEILKTFDFRPFLGPLFFFLCYQNNSLHMHRIAEKNNFRLTRPADKNTFALNVLRDRYPQGFYY